MRYEIIDSVLRIYAENEDTVPHVEQPTWPNGDAWQEGEAEAWAEQYILSLTDSTSDFPGPDRTTPTLPRPTEEEYAAHRASLPIEGISAQMLDDIVAQKVAEALAAAGVSSAE